MSAKKAPIRTFTTGATRDADHNKYDYEGFLCPLVMREFAAYMHKNRVQSNGQVRDSDNWQKGIPRPQYMKSMFRHFIQAWLIHRGHAVRDEKGHSVTMQEALCAVLFNAMGYLHEFLKSK